MLKKEFLVTNLKIKNGGNTSNNSSKKTQLHNELEFN